METKNHLDLARSLMAEDWFCAGSLSRALFAFGNIYPDINVLTYFRGHTYGGAQKIIVRKIHKLERKAIFSAWDYFQLGVLLHYVADIFTTAHNAEYTGGFRDHLRYEKNLRVLFRARLEKLRPSAWKLSKRPDPLGFLRKKYGEYTAQAWHPQRDCAYIIAVCKGLVLHIGQQFRPAEA